MTGKYDVMKFTLTKNMKVKIERWIQEEDEKKNKFYKKKAKTIRLISNERKTAPSTSGNVAEITIPESSNLFSFSKKTVEGDIDDVIAVSTGKELPYTILDYYVSILIQESNSNNESGIFKNRCSSVRLDTVPVYFLPVFHDTNVRSIITPDFDESPKTDLKHSIVFAPMICCQHYYLAVYDFPEKTINIFDSARYHNSEDLRFHQALNLWKVFLARMSFENSTELETMEDGWKCNFELNCAQQDDIVSCGYFVIYFIQNLLNGTPDKCNEPLSTVALREIQENILKKVLSTTKIGEKFLGAIST